MTGHSGGVEWPNSQAAKPAFHSNPDMAQVEVKEEPGKVLDSQGFKGTASRWGSSYSAEEYRKAISDAVVDLLKNMFSNDAFMKSLG